MNKNLHILVKIGDFINYQNKYGHNRLDKWYKIYSASKTKTLFELSSGKLYEEEIFSGLETNYKLDELNNDCYIIKFISNSNTEYRFDLLKEPNLNIYHLGFSLYDNNLNKIEEYESLTDKNEALEVFNRLIWILKDINPKLNIEEYCIGATGDIRKDKIYQYMMRFVSSWEKRNTNDYKLGWAIYFKL
jgi:hypothetical protein